MYFCSIFRRAGDQSTFLLLQNRIRWACTDCIWISNGSDEFIPPPSIYCPIVVVDDIDTVAQLLKCFCRELPEPIFTFDAFDKLMQLFETNSNSSDSDLIKQILSVVHSMPDEHWRTLLFLLGFLAEIANHASHNKMGIDNIAVVFAPTLLRPRNDDPHRALVELKISQGVLMRLLMVHMENLIR